MSRALFGALVAAQVAYGRLAPSRPVGPTRAIVGLMLATALSEAHAARGRRGLGQVAAAGALGYATEVVGVRTGRPFGHYAYSGLLGPGVAGVPFLVAGPWAMMSRASWVAAGWAAPRARVPVAAAALTAWDVFLDPRMVRDGYWTWPGGGRYEGVPATNFLGWFVTGLGVFGVWALADAEPVDERDDLALALYGWTWVGETVANAVFWRRGRVALAGAAAMGAVALPALRARLGR